MLDPMKKTLAGIGALGALALGGAAIAGAATSQSSTTTPQRPPAFNGPAHGTAAHEDAEKPVTGDSAAKAQAAAIKSVGGGTAGAVTTDLPGTGFETTVTKPDGTKVEVHLDGSYRVMQHPGPGGQHPPGPHPGPGGQHPPGPPLPPAG